MAGGIECYRIRFPKGMDANEYALKVSRPRRACGVLVRTRCGWRKGKPAARQPTSSPEARPREPQPG